MIGALVGTVVARYLRVTGAFAAAVLTARFLGAAGRGDYFFVVTVAALVAHVANLGLHASNLYLSSRTPEVSRALAANSFWVAVAFGGLGGVASGVIIEYGPWFSDVDANVLLFTPLLAVPTIFFMLGTSILIGTDRIRTFNAFEIGCSLIVVVGVGIASALALGVDGFLAANTGAWLLCALVLLRALLEFRDLPSFRWRVFVDGLGFAAKSYAISLLGFLVLRINVLLLAQLADGEEVGRFSVATQVAEALIILPATIGLLLFPRLVRDTSSSWNRTLQAAFFIGAIMALVCSIMAFLSEPFVKIAFGAEFASSPRILRWLLPGVFAASITTMFSQFLAAHGIPRIVTFLWAIAAAIVVLLGLVLIPNHGAVGAAIASSCGYLFLAAATVITGTIYRGRFPS